MISPIFAVGSALRQDRVFHPRGVNFRAEVKPAEEVKEDFVEVAEGLSQGEALARLSPGTFRGDRGLLPDVLGFSIRFNTDPAEDFRATCQSQDVLLATARSLLTLPLAALKTNQRDFLDNNYHGAAPFEIAGMPWMRLRLVPLTPPAANDLDRFEKIRKAVEDGEAAFRLDVISMRQPAMSSPLVEIRLVEEVPVDEDDLGFHPFNVGQGIRPMGFVQFTRHMPYVMSQYARDIF
jgi:hypothetical protein